MSKALKPFWIILLAIGIVMAISFLGPMFAPKELIPWRTDLEAAKIESRTTNKPLLLYFTASWCGPCQQMKRTTFADQQVESALQKFIPVKIDGDAHRELKQSYHVEAFPTFVISDANDDISKTTVGALPTKDFLAWLGR